MSGRYRLVALLGASWTALASLAIGQITSLADDILLLSKGVQTQQQTTVDHGPNSLGPSPGSGASLFGRSAPEATGYRQNRDVFQAISTEGQRRPPEQLPFQPPQTIPAQPQPPFLGALELP